MAKQRGLAVNEESDQYMPGAGVNYLLAIGIDKYQHWEPLHNAVNDARTFADLLVRQYQFEEEHIHTLFDAEATEANIYQKIRELRRAVTPQDNLVIYYSGHGHYDEDFAEGHWVPVEAPTNRDDAYVSNSDIIKRVNAIPSHHTLVIVDSCFSGTLVVQNRNASVDERFPSRRILASGRNETVSDGAAGQHSPFADGLITYLRNNSQPQLRTTNLIQYVKDQVAIHSQQSPVEGRIPNSEDKGGEFVFHLRRDEDEYWTDIQTTDTVEAYRNYQLAFPAGKYTTQAERRLTALREDEIWATAQRNDNETAYDGYLKKYAPSGKYVDTARARVESLRRERQERERVRAEMADRENQREAVQKQFLALVEAAETAFNERNLAEARAQYQAAMAAHLPGFVPKLAYLEEQNNLCKTNIEFLRHYDRGQQAADSGNHRLAVQFFQEALKLHENARVEELLKHSQAQLRRKSPPRDQATQTTTTRHAAYQSQRVHPAVQSRKRGIKPWVWGIVGGFLLCFVVLLAIGLAVEDETGPTEPETTYLHDPNVSPVDPTGYDPVVPSSSTPQQQVLGDWYTEDVLFNGQSVSQLDMSAWTDIEFTFYANGNVDISSTAAGTQTYTYQIDGDQFYLSDPAFGTGVIHVLDDEAFVFTIPYSEDGGYTVWPMQYYLAR